MRCSECQHWLRGRWVSHPSVAATFRQTAGDDEGRCRSAGFLDGQITKAMFGCIEFAKGNAEDQVERIDYPTEPWETFDMGPCPDCRGEGSRGADTACHRCAGTAKVRHYADGYVGEEQTREHPMEKRIRLEAAHATAIAAAKAELEKLENTPPV